MNDTDNRPQTAQQALHALQRDYNNAIALAAARKFVDDHPHIRLKAHNDILGLWNAVTASGTAIAFAAPLATAVVASLKWLIANSQAPESTPESLRRLLRALGEQITDDTDKSVINAAFERTRQAGIVLQQNTSTDAYTARLGEAVICNAPYINTLHYCLLHILFQEPARLDPSASHETFDTHVRRELSKNIDCPSPDRTAALAVAVQYLSIPRTLPVLGG